METTLEYIKSKYTTSKDVYYQLKIIRPTHPITSRFYSLSLNGLVFVRAGYGFDGPSGPTIDTPDVIFCSVIHDVLYEMFTKGELDLKWRKAADQELKDIGIACGASHSRMKVWKSMVRIFARKAALPISKKKIYIIPAVTEC